MVTTPANVVLEADGGSRGNPGPAGFGALIRDADSGEVIAEAAEAIGRATNNVAEYRGLIAGLELYNEHTPSALLEVRMDSKLVIEQMAGRWKIKHPDMRPLAIAAQQLAPFGTIWTWVPREQNKAADRLANLAMDAAARGERFDVGAVDGGAVDVVAVEGEIPVAAPLTGPGFGWSTQAGAPTTLVLLRHGVTVHSGERRFSGSGGDDPELLAEGVAQAQRAARALAADGGFDAIVASPMRRTRETARPVAEALGLEVSIDDNLREAAYGHWDGHSLDEVADAWPAELEAWSQSFEYAPPGGESIVDVQQRVEAAVQSLLTAYAGQKILIVTHVNPIKLSVRYCLDAPLASMNRMLVAPASLTTLSFYESGASSLRQFSTVP